MTETKGIAVLGSHPATVNLAPFDDPEWRIYACSPHNLIFQAQDGKHPNFRYLFGGTRPDGGQYRVDEWFEVHDQLSDVTRPYSYLRELERLPNLWTRDPEATSYIKDARSYPEQEMMERFGPFFFTSSIAYMLAKAIVAADAEKIESIGIWGVMQASDTEYAYQRPGIQYFIQRATELNIRVICPKESALFELQRVSW